MKHFVGGWAIGTFAFGTVLAFKMKRGELWEPYAWSAFVVGPLIGLAAWGLLP